MTDINRTITGVIVDSQYNIPTISNQLGTIIQNYCNVELAKVTSNVIPYKIETENGNLAGYFTLQTNAGIATLLQLQLRPAFSQFNSDIQKIIGNFILSNNWTIDILK